MNLQRIKTWLLNLLGETPTAYLQALRFVMIARSDALRDPETALLSHFLKENDLALDIGANGANWTYYLQQAVGKKGRVFAFEADPYYARATALAIRWMGLKGTTLFSFGLSDQNEQVALRIKDASGERMSGLSHIDKTNQAPNEAVQSIQLKVLDEMIAEYPALSETKLIKCDVEGYEFFVLRGAKILLQTAQPILIFEIGNFEMQGYTKADLNLFLKDLHYDIFALTAAQKLIEVPESLVHPEAMSVNRIAIPEKQVNLLDPALFMRFGPNA